MYSTTIIQDSFDDIVVLSEYIVIIKCIYKSKRAIEVDKKQQILFPKCIQNQGKCSYFLQENGIFTNNSFSIVVISLSDSYIHLEYDMNSSLPKLVSIEGTSVEKNKVANTDSLSMEKQENRQVLSSHAFTNKTNQLFKEHCIDEVFEMIFQPNDNN